MINRDLLVLIERHSQLFDQLVHFRILVTDGIRRVSEICLATVPDLKGIGGREVLYTLPPTRNGPVVRWASPLKTSRIIESTGTVWLSAKRTRLSFRNSPRFWL